MAAGAEQTGSITVRNLIAWSAVLVFAPMVVFAFWLQPAPAALTVAGAFLGFAVVMRASGGAILDARVTQPELLACLAASLAVFVLGGGMHFFYGAMDWRQRDAVLWDLVRDGAAGGYAFEGRDYVLRAPFGLYMLPMLAGKAFGLVAAHFALLLQNAILLGAILGLFLKIGGSSRRVAVMLVYGGLSIVGFAMLTAFTEIQRQQFVDRFGLDTWHPYLQFTSSLNQFFWVPNHALPAWWLTALVVLRNRGAIDSATLAAGVVGALFWSPLVIVPIVVWLAFFVLRDLRRELASPRLWSAGLACACAIPLAIYISIGADTIHSGMAIDLFRFWPLYGLFLAIQLAPAIYVFVSRDDIAPREDVRWWWMAIPVLVALPLVSFGPANDLQTRGAMPSLVVIAYLLGGLVTRPGAIRSARGALGWVIVVVSSASALWAIWSAVSRPPFEISDCTLVEAHDALGGHKRGVPTNYAVPVGRMPSWLLNMEGFKPAPLRWRACWSDIDERLNPLEPVPK